MKSFIASIVLYSVMASNAYAQNAEVCLTKLEMRALVTLVVDRGSERLVEKCGTAMPDASPFLSQNGPAVKARFDDLRGKSTAIVLSKIFPFLPSDETPLDNVVGAIIDSIIERSFNTDMTAEACGQADAISQGLAELSDDSLISALTVMTGRFMTSSKRNNLPFRPCPEEQQP